jgi:hypothetical protein
VLQVARLRFEERQGVAPLFRQHRSLRRDQYVHGIALGKSHRVPDIVATFGKDADVRIAFGENAFFRVDAGRAIRAIAGRQT